MIHIKDVNGKQVLVNDYEVYKALADILGLRQPAKGTIYWVDNNQYPISHLATSNPPCIFTQ